MEFGKKILFVFSDLPFPARLNGISVRYAAIITMLAARHDVHVAIVARPGESQYPEGLDQICKSVNIFRRERARVSLVQKAVTRVAKCFSSDVPYPLYSYDSAEIEQFIRSLAQPDAYDLIVWVGSMHLEIGLKIFGLDTIVHDAIDSLYHGHLRNRQRSFFHKIDSVKIAAWERYLVSVTKCTSFVSQADAALFAQDAALAQKVAVFPNGVFLGDFVGIQGATADTDTVTVGFLGHMGYRPNIEAARRLAGIFGRVQARDAEFRLLIIGRDPVSEVQMLAENEGVTVTGAVENIWEYIAKVDIFVFPMVSGAGQQNKVLEAMYGGKLVICNALANSGVGAVDNVHLLVKETDEEFAAAILEMKNEKKTMASIANNGRRFVQGRYSWEKIVPMLEEFWLAK